MDQLHSFADERLVVGCLYCSAVTENREHIPSRVLLDKPYPENLPVMPSCLECNEGFSLDEEYFACLVECARTGSADEVKRPTIYGILQHSSALAARIMQARTVSPTGICFQAEYERVKRVVVKLARGHAAYELDAQKREEPKHIMFTPIHTLSDDALRHFESSHRTSASQLAPWPEVGTRAMQRMLVVTPPGNLILGNDWVEVQAGRYRYLVIDEGALIVRFVIGEYLACEVIWDADQR